MSLWIQETFVDVDKQARFGESDVYETRHETLGDLYRSCRAEYGRCTSRVYIDQEDGTPKGIGWVFLSRQAYDDDPKSTYLREVWVTVHEGPPRTVYQYHEGVSA